MWLPLVASSRAGGEARLLAARGRLTRRHIAPFPGPRAGRRLLPARSLPDSPRRSCGHIFCSPCAHKSFERRAQCPLCSRAVTEQDITELVHGPETDAAAAVAVFSLAAVNPAEALRIVADAVAFARAQTALYGASVCKSGRNIVAESTRTAFVRRHCCTILRPPAGTREVWVRSREVDKIKRELVEKENQVNSMSVSQWVVRLRGCARRGTCAHTLGDYAPCSMVPTFANLAIHLASPVRTTSTLPACQSDLPPCSLS